jgi:hypothetical protein
MRTRLLPRHVTPAAVLFLASIWLACSGGNPPPPPSLEAIEIAPDSPSVEVGKSLQLTATAIYSDASRKAFTESLTWTSSDPQIVSVLNEERSKGFISGHAPGSAAITARHSGSGKTAQVQVTILAPPPVLRSVVPSTGPVAGGTEITLEGQWFIPGVTVTIGGRPVSSLARGSDSSLTGVTPPGTGGPQDIVVTTARGSVTLPGGFTYRGPPTVTQVQPTSGPTYGGTQITLRGSNFIPGTTVTLEGAELQDVTLIDDTTLTAITPPAMEGIKYLSVTNALGSAIPAGSFSYYDPWPSSSGGMYGGSVSVLAGQPSSEAYILYAGTTEGGVFMSVTSGDFWLPISTGLTNLDIRALAIDPTSNSTLYAGTNGGLFKTTNNGHSWSQLSHTLESQPIYALVLDPANPATLYAGVPNQGVFKTTDGGATWSAVNNGLGSLYIKSLAMDPANAQVLYAGTISGAIFKTSNGGASWFPARMGVPDTVL